MENPGFDKPFKNTVCGTVRRLNQDANESVNDAISISSEEIESALKLAHKGKACGDDGFFFAGVEPFKMLSNLFSAMIKFAHVPVDMKKGNNNNTV